MRTGTVLVTVWSSPPLTCMSWRAECSLITGPSRTRERNHSESASSPPPAWPDLVSSSGFFTYVSACLCTLERNDTSEILFPLSRPG